MLRFQRPSGRAHIAFTDRLGGESAPPFDRLNLGGHVGDDPETVRANRRHVADAVGLPVDHVLYMNQV
ncbi:MAG: laccase domain-containing protein, partial [Jiangellaceae bacterium]